MAGGTEAGLCENDFQRADPDLVLLGWFVALRWRGASFSFL
jgi:hypothetical protein